MSNARDEFAALVRGLRPLASGQAVPDLRMLTRRKPDGWKVRIHCSVCETEAWEKRGNRYHCWNCDGHGDVIEADGDDWKLAEKGSG